MLETQPGGATFKDTDYDAEGMIQSVSDGNGARTDYAYVDGLLKSKTSTGAGWSHWGVKTQYGYDTEGRLAAIAHERDVMIDQYSYTSRPHSESYSYDPETGRIYERVTSEGTIGYEYDGIRALSRLKDDGKAVDYGYDASGRLAWASSPEAGVWEDG